MTLKLKIALDIIKLYQYAENKLPSYGSSKVTAQTDRQTQRQTDKPDWK